MNRLLFEGKTVRSVIVCALGPFVLWALVGCNAPFWYVGPDLGGEDKAKKERRPILLYYKAWDSTRHRNMRNNILNAPEVMKELRETVNIDLEFAFFEEHARRYGVTRAQVCVMCDPDGNKVDTALYVNPVPTVPRFLEWFRRARDLAEPPPATTRPGAEK